MNETPLYFSGKLNQLFGVLHQPEQEFNGKAFVFCHPYLEEKLWAHRVYVSFARELARLGYAVLRFDYSGYGDSEGDFTSSTLTSHSEDIGRATDFLRHQVGGIQQTGLLGLRLGASLAWLSAEQSGITGPLILWDPVLNGEDYALDILRSNLTTQLAVYGSVREDREQLVEKLQRNELVNVDGYELGRAMYQELAALRLENHCGNCGDQVLVVQIGRNEKQKRQPAWFAEQIGAELLCVVEEPFWREINRFYYRADALFGATLGWLETCS